MTTRASKDEKYVLVLLSSMAGNRNQMANSDMSLTILRGKGIEPVVVDASDSDAKERRDKLFEISGVRGNYPQIFKVHGRRTTFLGDFDAFQDMNEDGSLAELAASLRPADEVGSEQPPKPVRIDSVTSDQSEDEGSDSEEASTDDDDEETDDEDSEQENSMETITIESRKDVTATRDSREKSTAEVVSKNHNLIRLLLVVGCVFLILDIVLVAMVATK